MTEAPSSPICYAGDADDMYMGYARREELLKNLYELLEAERAGVVVATVSSKETSDAGYNGLMHAVREDEARWCAMLVREISRLGAAPSRKVGAFRDKAMAIDDPLHRLEFLNKGQIWVVRKLETLIPRVRDDNLHRHLREMLESHRRNIDLASAFLHSDDAAPR